MSDDDLRRRLRSFVDGDIGRPDLDSISQGHRPRVRRRNVERALAVAVILAIALGGVALVAQLRSGADRQVPINPTPSPTPLPTLSVEPTPTAPGEAFPTNPGAGVNPGPVGGVGDTIAGLRLDDVSSSRATCPDGAPCPAAFDLLVTNTTEEAGRWEVVAYVYRNSVSALGNSTFIELAPGESGLATVDIDTAQAPDSGRAGTYSWNWSASEAR